ncbi:MAG TPA: HEAT repeat domain-containing protein [Pirellulales bacterium]|nr:HEAT repeat domain-containing protein [Pirellulales bacterium]
MAEIIRPVFASFGIALAFTVGVGRADIFELSNGGQITGELTNREETPRQKYVIQTPDGSTFTFERAQIKKITAQSPVELEYENIRPTFADTADGQWQLAEWCREKSYTKGRQTALERVLQLDPENKQAHMALGYSQVDGRWVQQDQAMQEQGRVRYMGQWVFPQEKELLEQKRKDELAEKQWFITLKRWRGGLDDPTKADEVHDELTKLNDPTAVPALVQALDSERSRQARVWFLEALGRIGTPDAVKAIVEHSLGDSDDELRLTCFDQLTGNAAHLAVPLYAADLKSKDNVRVNRAGYALGKLGDKTAILPLIDALVTTHTFTIDEGSSNPGQISAGFSPTGGGGMTMGSAPKRIRREMTNQQVLDALISLTGGVNYGFDKGAWRKWYASEKKPTNVDTRRTE